MSDTQVLEGIMLDGTQPPLVHLQAIKTVSLIISGYGGSLLSNRPASQTWLT